MIIHKSSKASALVAVPVLIALTTLGICVHPVRGEVRTLAPLDYQLLKACHENDTQSALAAISSGADVNVKDRFDETPLLISGCSNNPSIITALVDRGARLEEKDILGRTALFDATVWHLKMATEALLQRHASTAVRDNLGVPYEIVVSASQPQFSESYNDLLMILYSLAAPTAQNVDDLNEWRVKGKLPFTETVPPSWDPSLPGKIDDRRVDPSKKRLAIAFAAQKGGELATATLNSVKSHYRPEVLAALHKAFRAYGYDLASKSGDLGDDDVLSLTPIADNQKTNTDNESSSDRSWGGLSLK